MTDTVGVGHPGFSVGAAFGDLDNDGDLDLYVVSFDVGADVLYRNEGPVGPGGEHVLNDVTGTAGVTDETSSRGVAFADYDRDGLLDIYVNAIGPDILYRNLGGFRFTNVAGLLGVNTPGQGVGVVATDLDTNGWIDLFTGNRSGDPNRLYLNNQGVFTEITAAAGIDEVGLGMGVLSFDYDNDLDFDLYWTAWPGTAAQPRPNALYENLGGGRSFVDVAAASGTDDPNGWGISCNSGDVDNDGWEDFFVTNGFDATSSANVLFLNHRDGTFMDLTSALGGADFDGRGVAFADFDQDGDLDLCVTGGPGDETRLWRNDTVNGSGWITLELQGTASNRSAIGARVEVVTDLATTVKEVSGGAGRGSQNSLPLEFGLGSASVVSRITIRWPSGQVESLGPVALNQIVAVVEGGDNTPGCRLSAGDPGFCRECGPCEEGQGACRTDDECAVGLVCMENFGDRFGLAPRHEVCATRGSLPAAAYAVTELPEVPGVAGSLDSIAPRAINSAGQVVGQATAGSGSSAFRFTPGTGMEKLDPRGDDSSSAWTINEAGDVFGYLLAPGSSRRGVRSVCPFRGWQPRRSPQLRPAVQPTGGSSFQEINVADINERLEFVGRVRGTDADGAPVERFFYFSPPFGLLDIQDLLSAAGSGRTMTDIIAINDWGEMLIRFQDGALVLSPISD